MPNQIQPEPARSADSFVDTVGTNLHLTAKNGVYYTHYDSIIKPKLIELGLRHVRQGGSYTTLTTATYYYDRINELGRSGIKFNFILDPRGFSDVTKIPAFAAKVNGALESFEGPNEYDNSGNSNWVSTLRAYQESLYKSVKGNSATANFPVLGPTLVRKESYDPLGDLSAFLDYGNMHNYFSMFHPGTSGWGAGGYGSINWNLNMEHKVCGTKPVITTETGYSNVSNGLPETVSGKYIPRIFLEQFNHGISRTFNYEFIDGILDPNHPEANFGLLRNDGSPKPAYTTLKNLISILKDPGASFTPGSLDYALSGSTMNLHKTLLQKRDGRFYLILWVELPSYDVNAKQQIAVPSQQVTLSLNTSISKAITYLPNTSTATITQYFNQKQLVLNVPDEPLVVELTPTASVISDTGLKGEYYDNVDFTNPKLVRTDATVNFNWGGSSPDPAIGADTFSVRWTGQVQPKYSESYTFYTSSNDGVRLWVDNQLLINNWTNQGVVENRGTISLMAGQKYDVKMEYYENTGSAVANLSWSSLSQAKEIIPQSQLFYLPLLTDIVWVEDTLPTGAFGSASGGDAWNWVSNNPAPFSGRVAHQSNIAEGIHQHYFTGAVDKLQISPGEMLIAYVYLDPSNLPSEIMLQWYDGSWDHRAYWGANKIGWGADGTAGRFYMGPLPAAGQWIRLEVPASQVGLESRTLSGMAFALYGGRATWDYAGKK